MKKLQLTDVKSGSLVSRIREERIEFIHEGEEYEVDVLIKTLPFIETESLQKRMNNKEEVVSEWIAKSLVDEKGKPQFTKKQVDDNFVQPLASAIFDKVWGVDDVKKILEKQKTKKE